MTLLFTQPNRKFLDNSYQPFTYNLNNRQIYSYTYVIHCTPTDQYYIGQRSTNKHPLMDNYKGSGTKIWNLKKQYDWFKDFEVTIVQCYNNKHDLAVAESELIKHYQEKYKDKCLNIHSNIQTSLLGKPLSEQHKQNLKLARNTTEYKQKQSEKTKSYRQQHPELSDQYRLIMKDKWDNDEAFRNRRKEVAIENSIREKQLYKEHPELIYRKGFYKGQAVVALEDFTSPMNGRFFKAGTVFQSAMKASKIVGFSHERSFVNSVTSHKEHPMVWITKIHNVSTYISSFKYVSDLTKDQLKQFNIDPNNLTFTE